MQEQLEKAVPTSKETKVNNTQKERKERTNRMMHGS